MFVNNNNDSDDYDMKMIKITMANLIYHNYRNVAMLL